MAIALLVICFLIGGWLGWASLRNGNKRIYGVVLGLMIFGSILLWTLAEAAPGLDGLVYLVIFLLFVAPGFVGVLAGGVVGLIERHGRQRKQSEGGA